MEGPGVSPSMIQAPWKRWQTKRRKAGRLRSETIKLARALLLCFENYPKWRMSLQSRKDAEAMINLDQIDRRLLAELQDEGRVTNVELAQRVGLTAPPCLRRVRSLEEAGVIKGYHAELDPSKLGFAISVFALVSLKSQAEEALRQFEDHVAALPEVRECHMLNGEIDFILKIVSKDLQSFQEFLTSKLTPAPNVASVKTSLTIRTAKHVPGVPL
jgi:DNA-binding Lrp family transcriptional regulator